MPDASPFPDEIDIELKRDISLGRVYYDKKRGEGKTKKEALRALKRQVSDAVYQRLVADQK